VRPQPQDSQRTKALEQVLGDQGLEVAAFPATEDQVVADALRLMQARDEVTEIKRARLKDAIDRGYENGATGRVIRFETDDQIDAFFADL